MLIKTLFTSYTLTAIGMTLQTVLDPLASSAAIAVEHIFIIGIGAWALIELIKQGKKMVTREELDVKLDTVRHTGTKLREDLTSVVEKAQDAITKRMEGLENRERERLGQRGN